MNTKKLLSFDAFAKTVEDARIKTASGGLVTIVSLALIMWLTISEWIDYRHVEHRPSLIVDKDRGQRMEINVNISFPHIPCALLTMDVMDASGEVQAGIEHGIMKTRLGPDGVALSTSQLKLESQKEEDAEKSKSPDYCGPCYGAKPDSECCNTCEDVKQAYAVIGWAFHDGSGMEQCENENYQERIQNTKNEGCNIAGHVSVNRVTGNFHFAPGNSLTAAGQHQHDTSLYYRQDMPFRFSHEIHHLSFGPEVDNNPLDGTQKDTNIKAFNYLYFVKVVATRFEPLKGEVLETNQYSVTSHERPLTGGRDEDHPHTLHQRGGLPGVFFSYDISPMKVINREQRAKSFGAFLTSVCAIVGGVLTVAAIVDRGVWEADKALKRRKEL